MTEKNTHMATTTAQDIIQYMESLHDEQNYEKDLTAMIDAWRGEFGDDSIKFVIIFAR